MKKAGKKLIISVFVLVVALSLAVTSTFAWFTMSTTPKVESFNVNVTTANGLMVSLNGDAGSYRSKITSTEIQALLTTNYPSFELDACTSENGKSFFEMDGTTDASSKMISFDLYFYSNVAQTIKLKSDGVNTVKSAKNGSTTTDYAKAYAEIAAGTYGDDQVLIAEGADLVALAANAARISFVDEADTAVIWYPNPDKGFNKDVDFYSVGTVEAPYVSKNLALDYYNQITNVGTLTAPPYYTAKAFSESYVDDAADNYIITDDLITLAYDENGGYYGTLKVNIWLEGYDGDCFDSIFDDILTIALQFQGAAA